MVEGTISSTSASRGITARCQGLPSAQSPKEYKNAYNKRTKAAMSWYYRNHETAKKKNREANAEWQRKARIALKVLEELGIEI